MEGNASLDGFAASRVLLPSSAEIPQSGFLDDSNDTDKEVEFWRECGVRCGGENECVKNEVGEVPIYRQMGTSSAFEVLAVGMIGNCRNRRRKVPLERG